MKYIDILLQPILLRFVNHRVEAIEGIIVIFLIWMILFLLKKAKLRLLIWMIWSWLLFCMLYYCRGAFPNPVMSVNGDWALMPEKVNGKWKFEGLINLTCFIPFTLFSKILRRHPVVSFMVCLAISISFETLQLYYSLGAFQLSDIIYNATGGLIGSLIYLFLRKITS